MRSPRSRRVARAVRRPVHRRSPARSRCSASSLIRPPPPPDRRAAGSGRSTARWCAPSTRPPEYAAGHRGVDFAVAAGTPVRAANDGVVSFAGSVAGTLHVTVAHAGGLRTSYSFLSSVSVRAGETVARGDVIGTTGGVGGDHDGAVLHLGLRVGDRYVDPMLLFRPADLTKLVRLVPAGEPTETPWSPARERRELQASLHLPGPGPIDGAATSSVESEASCDTGIPFVGDAVDAVCDVGAWLGDRCRRGDRHRDRLPRRDHRPRRRCARRPPRLGRSHVGRRDAGAVGRAGRARSRARRRANWRSTWWPSVDASSTPPPRSAATRPPPTAPGDRRTG